MNCLDGRRNELATGYRGTRCAHLRFYILLTINNTLNILSKFFSHTDLGHFPRGTLFRRVAFHREQRLHAFFYTIPRSIYTFNSNFRIRSYGKCVSNIIPKAFNRDETRFGVLFVDVIVINVVKISRICTVSQNVKVKERIYV